MANTANIAIDLSNGETVAGAIAPGYRLVIATNEGRSNVLKLDKWAENHPVIISDSLCVEYYQQSSLMQVVKATPYNVSGRLYLRVSSNVAGATLAPSAALFSATSKVPVYFRISSARADFVMTVTVMGESNSPAVTVQSQKQEDNYHLTVNLPDSRLSRQYVVTIPDDGVGHRLSQGNALPVKLPYYTPEGGASVWKL